MIASAPSPGPRPTASIENLREMRESFGFTTPSLAYAAGVPLAVVRRAEAGEEISMGDLNAIVSALEYRAQQRGISVRAVAA